MWRIDVYMMSGHRRSPLHTPTVHPQGHRPWQPDRGGIAMMLAFIHKPLTQQTYYLLCSASSFASILAPCEFASLQSCAPEAPSTPNGRARIRGPHRRRREPLRKRLRQHLCAARRRYHVLFDPINVADRARRRPRQHGDHQSHQHGPAAAPTCPDTVAQCKCAK